MKLLLAFLVCCACGLLYSRWRNRYRRAADRLRDSPPGIWPYGGP